MKKVYQQNTQNITSNEGDNVQACIASILNKEHNEVPDFMEQGEERTYQQVALMILLIQ